MAQTMMMEQGSPADGSLLAVLAPWLAVVAHQEPSLAVWRQLACIVEAFVKECEPEEDLRQAEQSLAWNQPDYVVFWLGYAVIDAREAAERWTKVQTLLQDRFHQGDLSCVPLLGCAVEHAERATEAAAAVLAQVTAFCEQHDLSLPERVLG